MARARNIKPSLFKNELLGEADPLLTILFVGLWCLADRRGRLEDRPKRIKAEIFPYREIQDFNGYLTVLERLGFIQRYSANGGDFIQVVNFEKHQSPHKTERESEIPENEEKSDGCLLTVKAPLTNECATVKESLIPDSLIPDSLIPDSLNPEINTPLTPQGEPGGEKPKSQNLQNPNTEKPSKAKKSKPPKFQFENEHMALATWMSNPVVTRFPHMANTINLDEWADTVRRMIETDGRTRTEIMTLWAWVVNHSRADFSWADNCRTPMKLRQRTRDKTETYFDLIDRQRTREAAHEASKPGAIAGQAHQPKPSLIDRVKANCEQYGRERGVTPEALAEADGDVRPQVHKPIRRETGRDLGNVLEGDFWPADSRRS